MNNKWIPATKLIEILQPLIAQHGDELGVECNSVGNLLVSNKNDNIGFIVISEHAAEYQAF